ncbi:MAG: DUF3244 domain-containing protein [Clostridium sp.]|nr:DUF3244 domain-containing protein [Bacteroides sp.]MCM1197719.1 DUF3244 domain-containing protein [Clostridium sp.]
MKKSVLFFVAIVMAFVSACPVFADGRNDGEKKSDKDIIIRIGDKKGGGRHHAPARIPMEVSYMSFVSALRITFLNDLGNVEVNMTNNSTGEYIEGTVNASAGVTMLPISSDDGFYTITFTLSGGTTYYGEFEL